MPDVTFSVAAETQHGSGVRAVGSVDALGRWDPARGLPLQTQPGSFPRWSALAWIPPGRLEYKFVVVGRDGSVTWEEGPNRVVSPGASGPAEPQTPRFRKEGFSSSSSSPQPQPPPPPPRLADGWDVGEENHEVVFEAVCSLTKPGEAVLVVGSAAPFGQWDPTRGLKLTTSATTFPRWSGTASFPTGGPTVEWKLVVRQSDGSMTWEACGNRHLKLPQGAASSWIIRVHFGGACSDPENMPLRHRSKSNPAAPPNTVAPSLRRVATESAYVGIQAGRQRAESESWTSAAPALAPVPAAPAAAPAAAPLPAGVGAQAAADGAAEAGQMKCPRSSSLSLLPAVAPGRSEIVMPFASSRRTAASAVSREDQQIVFTLDEEDVPAARASALVIEASFEADGTKWPLKHEPTPSCQRRWVLSLLEAGRQQVIHLLCFLVGGMHVLSKDLPVIGDLNAVLFSETLRRYFFAREGSQGQSPDHGFLQTSFPATRGVSTPQAGRSFSATTADDTEVPGEKYSIPRPNSICCTLAALGDDDEDSGNGGKGSRGNFSKDVFEGLYDAELRLRIDGYVLPEPAPGTKPRQLRLWSGAHLLKKKVGTCEDAYFTGQQSLGVADGVGCMVQFASYGINAAAYAAELMTHAAAALKEGGSASDASEPMEKRVATALGAAEQGAEAYGASTITVLAMEGSTVGVANLGDSGFMLLRKGQRGMTVVKKSEEQQHSWNCPYQLTRLPPALISRFPKLSLDKASDCIVYSFTVREGDLLLLFTDGLRDNLHDHEVLDIVDCALSPVFSSLLGLSEHCTPPERIARALAVAAQERSLDPVAKVPFVEYSRKHGFDCQGGKQDDITVVAAWVMPQNDPSDEVPGLKEALAKVTLSEPAPSPAAPAAVETGPEATVSSNAEGARSMRLERRETVPLLDPLCPDLLDQAATGSEDTSPVQVEEATNDGGEPEACKAAAHDSEEVTNGVGPPDESEATKCGDGAEATNSVMAVKYCDGAEATNSAADAPCTLQAHGMPPSGMARGPSGFSDDGAGNSDACNPVQPMFETSRRGSYERPPSTAGIQRRSQACKAEFRPMSSSVNHGVGKSRGRGSDDRRHESRQQ